MIKAWEISLGTRLYSNFDHRYDQPCQRQVICRGVCILIGIVLLYTRLFPYSISVQVFLLQCAIFSQSLKESWDPGHLVGGLCTGLLDSACLFQKPPDCREKTEVIILFPKHDVQNKTKSYIGRGGADNP